MRASTVFTFTVLALAVCAIVCVLIRGWGEHILEPEGLASISLMAAPFGAIALLAWVMRERRPVALAILIATLPAAGLGPLLVWVACLGGLPLFRAGGYGPSVLDVCIILWLLAGAVAFTAFVVSGFCLFTRRNRSSEDDRESSPDEPRHPDS